MSLASLRIFVRRPGATQPLQYRSVSIIGVDYGGKRIGIAVSESGVLATPHSVVANDGDVVRTIERLAALGDELAAETWVVGVAKRTQSDAGERKFSDFAARLRQRTCKEVVLWDETLSTVEAAERLRDSGRDPRQKKTAIDMYAAAVILQSYLDAAARRES